MISSKCIIAQVGYVVKLGIIFSLIRVIAAFTFGPIGEPTTN